MHDSRGAPLKVGDRVLIEAEVKSVEASDNGYCNVNVLTLTPPQKDPPPMAGSSLTLNTRMLTKCGAAVLMALSLLCLGAYAAEPPAPEKEAPQVQVDEVLRRGNMVSSCGEGPRSGPDESYKAAMAPPADDSQLWHISIWSTPGCQACEHLKSDFRKAPELLAFVATPDKSLPWAHYHEYSGADETQADRRKKYQISRYPTIIIQPPVALAADGDGIWGDPGLIVFYDNTGYSDPKALAAKIRRAVYKFADIQQHKGYPKPKAVTEKQSLPPERVEPMGNEGASLPIDRSSIVGGAGQITAADVGTAPPVATPPRVDPFNPVVTVPQPLTPPVSYPPADQPAPAPAQPNQPSGLGALAQLMSLLGTLFGAVAPGQSTGAVAMLILVGLKIYELRTGKKAPAWVVNLLSGRPVPVAASPGSDPAQAQTVQVVRQPPQ